MPGLAQGIALQIRDGEIKRYLIQPIDLIAFLLLSRVAHKLAYYVIAIIPFAFVFYLCRGYFQAGWPPAPVMLAFCASLVMGFLIGFFLEAAIGMIGFWFLEVTSLLFVYMLFSFFLSGHMFPLTLLPDSVETVVNFLPLKYLAYFRRRCVSWQDSGRRLASGTCGRVGVAGVVHHRLPGRICPRSKAVQWVWRVSDCPTCNVQRPMIDLRCQLVAKLYAS